MPAVIDRMGADRESLEAGVEQLLAAKSRVSGSAVELRIGRELAQLLAEAETIAANMKDEYTSTEHLLMAMASARNGNVRQLLERNGIDYNGIMQGLAKVRGSQRVTNQTPEAQYEALVKYGRDLTAEAGKGNLDPIIGRDQEIRRVVQILSRRTKNNPVLIGEPGVGKTAIAEGLAQRIINGDVPTTLKNKRLVALYLGALVAGAKYRGEFEKAHVEVFNVLLQAPDDGRLTDGQGRTVDFRNTVIIMTSNIGSQYIADVAGLDEEVERGVLAAMRQQFRPEFLNRVDDIVIFHSLSVEQLKGIAKIQLGRLQALLAEREITLELTDEAKALIVQDGYELAYGARPLKRAIQHLVADPLALEILDGRVESGDLIAADGQDGQIAFSVVAAPELMPALQVSG